MQGCAALYMLYIYMCGMCWGQARGAGQGHRTGLDRRKPRYPGGAALHDTCSKPAGAWDVHACGGTPVQSSPGPHCKPQQHVAS
eukprot:360672-Chlamydomonas_euryale.AAC.3